MTLDQLTLEYIERELVRNVFEVHSLGLPSRQTRLFVCGSEGFLSGYLFTSLAPEAVFVNVSGETEAVSDLLSFVPARGAVVIAPASLTRCISTRLAVSALFPMYLMAVSRGNQHLVASNPAVRLSPRFAEEYAQLMHSSSPISLVEESLERDSIYGVFADGRLVSVASVAARLPKAAFIIGVMTSPEYRGRGYATLATSAAVEDALASSELVSLGVRADNIPAISVYERLGFRRVGDEVWADLGTGLKP